MHQSEGFKMGFGLLLNSKRSVRVLLMTLMAPASSNTGVISILF